VQGDYRGIIYVDMRFYDAVVIGAGHAGCEAALAASRLGLRTLVVTISLDRIALMPCNCSIGGPAKGHLVREIDALGGEMGLASDAACTHIRMLNTGKGPAVRALRSQEDKKLYSEYMRRVMQSQRGLELIEAMVSEIVVEKTVSGLKRAVGVRTSDGTEIAARTVIVTTGTFLNGVIHIGEKRFPAGRADEPPSNELSDSLREIGFDLGRLKTGTTARVDKKTIDFDRVEEQKSDEVPRAFSYMTPLVKRDLLPCWLTHTNERTHEIIRANLERSAMYGGRIEGVGPRYCPSIEDKIVRFSDRQSHQVFLEQEGWDTDSVYVQGLSTSLPEDVQAEFIASIPGLEHARIIKPGYAIEYDFVPPTQIKPSLESKDIQGLFLAGQINGTSGYEEAAAQGLLAGVNAAMLVQERSPLVIQRHEGYIGVLVDDLVTKGVSDPYRLLTSRAEHRLVLRHDNADMRLTPIGREVGLVTDERWRIFKNRKQAVELELLRFRRTMVSPTDSGKLAEIGVESLGRQMSLEEILRRPEVRYSDIAGVFGGELDSENAELLEMEIKYRGYIERQMREIERAKRLEHQEIPEILDYHSIRAISSEAREKLSRVKPRTLGQASRIPGVTPADVAMLSVHIHRFACSKQKVDVGCDLCVKTLDDAEK